MAGELRGPQRTETTVANYEHRAITENLFEPGGKISLGQIDGAGNVSVGKLFWLAHVYVDRIRWPSAHVIQGHFAHLR